MLTDDLARKIAGSLDDAWRRGTTIPPLSETGEILTAEDAYRVQSLWTELRLANGDGTAGHKIGLTSDAMRAQMGVGEPDYGRLWTSRRFEASGRAVDLPTDVFIQPRIEGELAFLLESALPPGEVGTDDVLAATAAIAPCVEVVDSRIHEWRIRLLDTIADNASYGAFAVGNWSDDARDTRLESIEMALWRSGEIVSSGTGAGVFGSPARAVAWLANKLRVYGIELEPGEIVLSGSLGRAVKLERGDVFELRFTDQQPFEVRCM